MELNPEDGTRATPASSLARRARRAREKAGISLRDMAAQINFPHSYIHRIEMGKQLPSDDLAKALDRFFDAEGLFVELLEMARDHSLPDYGRAVLAKEPLALRIQTMTSTVVPGLLQTEDYARELIRIGHIWDSEDQLESWVAIRMRRKQIFDRKVPPHHAVLMDEAVLKRPIGGITCMASQLEHLLQVSESVYSTVLVLPFSCGAHSLPGGSATLLTLEDGTTVGHVEGIMVGEPVVSPDRLVKLARKFDMARSKALPEQDSVELIRHYLRGYVSGG
ncbi:helix-turn-helix transcriptional regulator [Streptomyces cheonanensis]|uniref:Helix-turn-helix transcriptional regulator n=1 Tax=Streptomyces cheonanensis TaxID=312720 RepID=A0ABN2VC20_9ACTN